MTQQDTRNPLNGQGKPIPTHGKDEFIQVGNSPPIKSRSRRRVVDPSTGRLVEQSTEVVEQDSAGLYIPADQIIGYSWTNKKLSDETCTTCRNPWLMHTERLCRINTDGFYTPQEPDRVDGGGNFLCLECYFKNEKYEKWYKWRRRLSFGLLTFDLY